MLPQGRCKQTLAVMICLFSFLLVACHRGAPNNPHLDWSAGDNVFFSSFPEAPKSLDPGKSYNDNEAIFLAQVVEPPLQYNYWKRPYTLEPLALADDISLTCYDKNQQMTPCDASSGQIATSVYTLHFRDDLYYQPHPAFALHTNATWDPANIDPKQVRHWSSPMQFPHLASRAVDAYDYAYAIKRLASPAVNSPIYGLMASHILGLNTLRQQLLQGFKPGVFQDLRSYDLSGVTVVDAHTLKITLTDYYPAFRYWLSMSFFAPIPWEVDAFYSLPVIKQKNIGFDTYPVGSGPYFLAKNDPNREIILQRNPNYHSEFFPTIPDSTETLQRLAGKRLPLIDTFVFKRESEALPRWQKFLQGYYDQSGVGADNFNQAITINSQGQTQLSPSLQKQHLRLQTQVIPSVFYFGFNMQDPVVGGLSKKKKALRQAIGIVLNSETYNQLFLNGQGIPAQGPIPPGVFGYAADCAHLDSSRYRCIDGHPVRKSLAEAKALMVKAGYPNGVDPKTKRPLRLRFDTSIGTSPDERTQLDWMRQRFAQLGIALDIEVTQYGRFQEKMLAGHEQLFMWGWNADYPDPENFLMLLYGPNGKVKYGGENAGNYDNPAYDSLFKAMQNLPDNAARLALIQQLVKISQDDMPVIWLFYPRAYTLLQPWVGPRLNNGIAYNTLKYASLNPTLRLKQQTLWNKPTIWPLLMVILLILGLFGFAAFVYHRHQQKPPGAGRL